MRLYLLVPLAVCALASLIASAAPVSLTDPALPAGVRYAADTLKTVSPAPVAAEVGPDTLAKAGPEGFSITPDGAGFRVCANTNAGLMYGLLELRDRIQIKQPPKQALTSSPAIRLRGDTVDFPFYLGVNLYEGRWRNAQSVETSPDSWWLDKGHWAWRLKRCADLRMNALLICHPHPFPGLVDLPDYPEAGYLPPEHLKRVQEHFKWMLDQAEQYGVRVYFLTWNIWVSPGFAKAHNVPQEGADTPLVRAYTRACYKRLFELYPKLAGVMTMSGEAPPGCVDFVRDAIVGGLNELPQPPELLYWIWCSYPEDAKVIFQEYKGPSSLVHYLQYEQLFRPQADPRILRASKALGGVPVVTLGGLGTSTGWMYWSDPYYIRDIMADLPRQNGEGCFFAGLDSFPWVGDKWLGWQGLARYWWDPSRPREDAYWQARLTEHYGSPEASADFLEASIAASAIVTRQLALLHRQTDHHHAQFGFPLVHYLGLPTLSTYVFENHEGIDAQGHLTPRLGLCWPNPDWGEKVTGVVDFVAGKTGGTTPVQIADELDRYADTVLARVPRLRALRHNVSEKLEMWDKRLDQMLMSAYLGQHVAAKTRAAIAWERWKRGQAEPQAVLAPLQASVEAMERLAEVSRREYAGNDQYCYRSCISRPLPWGHLEIWNLDQWRKHSFTDSANEYRQELEWVRDEMERKYSQPLLPFEDDLAAKPEGAKCILKWDCEGAPPEGLKINNFAPDAVAEATTGVAPLPLTGKRIVGEARKPDGFYFPINTDATKLPLQIGKRYWVRMDYWIVKDAEQLGDWLSAGARTTEGGWQKDIGARYMGGPAGTRGRITLSFTPQTWKDYYVYVSMHGQAKVELDNIEVWEG